MLTADRVKVISRLAFPFTIALSSTLLLALIDLAMVGSLGIVTVAAVGMATFCESLVVAAVAGLTPAVQGIVARRIGEGSNEPRCLPLNAGVIASVLVGAPLTLLCYLTVPLFMSLISSDPQVTAVAVPFLRILYFGLIAAGMNNAFEGHWAGLEKPKIYMSIILMISGLNIALNYTLIFGHFGLPALGARGAAIGTTTALYAGALLNCAAAFFTSRKEDGFLRVMPDKSLLTHILKLGLPSAMQQFLFAAG